MDNGIKKNYKKVEDDEEKMGKREKRNEKIDEKNREEG